MPGMQLLAELGQVGVPVAGELESGLGGESAAGESQCGDLVDAVCAHRPVAAGYEVPGAGLEYKTMRLQPRRAPRHRGKPCGPRPRARWPAAALSSARGSAAAGAGTTGGWRACAKYRRVH